MTDKDPERTEKRLDAAAELLAGCRGNGATLAQLPVYARPETEQEGYDVQRRVVQFLNAAPRSWKVSASGPSGPTAAPVWGGEALSSPTRAGERLLLETEIALRLCHDLPCRPSVAYTRNTILKAVDVFAVAFERVSYRLTAPDLPFPQRLADCLANDGLVIGTALPIADLRPDPVAHLTLCRNGTPEAFTPVNIDPVGALLAYANHGGDLLGGLKKGQWVLTGSMTGMQKVDSASEWSAVWNGVSEVRLSF
ncbi:hypothetical protein [Roseibium marinum]|uniref:2-keto-4-pentenoate hydratase n=1 Tax=Roseibium marinum TaxID=281252 RepID=A0A2S3V0V4_9HYPH|nr:hypothetical protein [Roseibium marinum]POF33588.1 2-keto-4-pentenoate hydratase [Roseibium marinum]